MSTTVKKYKIQQLQDNNDMLELHPETDADIVNYSKTISGTAVTTVKGALDKIVDGIGVTGVKGNAETDYRTGQVNITPENIGAQAAITDGSATIATESNGIVTIKAGVSQSSGAISNSSSSDIVLGAAATKTIDPAVTRNSNNLITSGAVWTAIDNLPEPMVFKGTIGSGGTITWSDLPVAGSHEGFTYKVIEAHGTTPVCKVGDVIVSNGISWIVIPAGDDVEDTWRNIKVNGTEILGNGISSGAVNFANGGHITVTSSNISGGGKNITFGIETGYSIPSNETQASWYTKPSKGIPITDLANIGFVDLTEATELSTIITLEQENQMAKDFCIIKTNYGIYYKYDLYNGIYVFLPIPKAEKQSNTNTAVLYNGALYFNTYSNSYTITAISGNSYTLGGRQFVVDGYNPKLYVLPTNGIPSSDLATSGVTAGTYSAVTVNNKGIVTAGGQIVEVGRTNQTTPSASLAVGGIFFKEI